MIFDSRSYKTSGGVIVSRSITEVKMDIALEDILFRLNSQRGGLLRSSYEYPGRYKRWAIGFVNPPLELTTQGNAFALIALIERGRVLLPLLLECLSKSIQLEKLTLDKNNLVGFVKPTKKLFTEEERSKQPSAFTVVREILYTFSSQEDEHLGLYGAFGYDLVLQFEPIKQRLE
ncbi:MAG: anthranilate synthase component I, partial [Tolypothrix sp. T3-bin4]|nr:anthranilate synthase component I [Tolypothrix sp. T3-bin4]